MPELEFEELTLPWQHCGARAVWATYWGPFERMTTPPLPGDEMWVCDEHVRAALSNVLDMDWDSLVATGHGFSLWAITLRRLRPDELLEVEKHLGHAGCQWGVGLPLPRDTRN